jgi:pyruvate-ferredoxin/flavodoxin oxidoreductase
LRFGPHPLRSSYLITQASFVACHQFSFLERIDMLRAAENGATFLLNSTYGPDEVWDHLPRLVQKQIIDKKLKFYVIDGYDVAKETGMGGRINTIMQTCFFAISGVLPREEAIAAIKHTIEKTYGKRGVSVVQKNFAAVDAALSHLHQVKVPDKVTSSFDIRPAVPAAAPEFVQKFTARIIEGNGDDLPVSAMPVDGTFPTATTQWERRNIALEIPEWDQELCIQCGKCVLVCPHAVIRAKVYDESAPGRRAAHLQGRARALEGHERPEVHPAGGARGLHRLHPVRGILPGERQAGSEAPRHQHGVAAAHTRVRSGQLGVLPEHPRNRPQDSLAEPGEGRAVAAAAVRVLRRLLRLRRNPLSQADDAAFRRPRTDGQCHRLLLDLRRQPAHHALLRERGGLGPTWSNSLFEDCAEFGLGMRLAVDKQNEYARELVWRLNAVIGDNLAQAILNADQKTEPGIFEQRERVKLLKEKLAGEGTAEARDLLAVADTLVKKSVWLLGGDGWAYDIGYGGLDHVLSTGRNVNILVLDTEVYSNTGGQASKATPRGAVAKFAAGGKPMGKKDLGLMAMSYGNVYVAKVAMGAGDMHTVKAFLEAEAYDGPSLIIAYSHCIAHGYDLSFGMEQQKVAVSSGYWPLMRYNPELTAQGKNPFQLDSRPPSTSFKDYAYKETRYTMLVKSNPEEAKKLLGLAEQDVAARWRLYDYMAHEPVNGGDKK